MKMFDAGKTRMIVLPYGEKKYDDMLSPFYLIPERHGQTERQTDGETERISISLSRVAHVWTCKMFFLISSYIVVHLLYICATHENGVSVRPSVRQSHAGIGSRLINIGLCGFHHCVAQLLYFLTPNFIPHV